jgi:hypothetical protein
VHESGTLPAGVYTVRFDGDMRVWDDQGSGSGSFSLAFA